MDIPTANASAPTPANSFATATLHTASSTAPAVSNVPEEDETEHAGGNPASLLANVSVFSFLSFYLFFLSFFLLEIGLLVGIRASDEELSSSCSPSMQGHPVPG